MESIDALAKAVNEFEGGMVLVSHDMRLIGQVAKEIWICDNKTITKYQGDILNFKMEMRAQMGIGELRGDASTKVKETTEAAPPPKKEKPKAPESKLEVVAPTKPAAPKPAVVDLAPPKPAPKKEEATPPAPAPAAEAPPKNRYIPPHLRRKMQQQASS